MVQRSRHDILIAAEEIRRVVLSLDLNEPFEVGLVRCTNIVRAFVARHIIDVGTAGREWFQFVAEFPYPGDILLVLTFHFVNEEEARNWKTTTLLVDENNKITKIIRK